jgi:peptide/nickel transport system permease protein
MAESTQSSVVKLAADPLLTRRRSESLWARAGRRLRKDYLTLIALSIIILLTVLTMGASLIAPYDPEDTDPVNRRLLPPGTPGHILGTDDLGRDYLTRLLYGGQISLAIGYIAAVLTLAIGIITGLVAGYFGGLVDDVMNWIITTLDSIPAIYLLLLVATLLQRSPTSLILVISLIGWTGGARLIRGQTLQLREREYVVCARAMGASPWRIMLLHILPNTLSFLFLALAGSIGGLILTESTLSFLQVGIQPPTPTWGNMLSNADQFFTRGPHMATISGLLIFITVLCLFVIGDGLRDAFDPQTTD